MGDNELLNIEPKVYVKFLLKNNIAISATFSMYCMQGVGKCSTALSSNV